jgi:hypothetical protein
MRGDLRFIGALALPPPQPLAMLPLREVLRWCCDIANTCVGIEEGEGDPEGGDRTSIEAERGGEKTCGCDCS